MATVKKKKPVKRAKTISKKGLSDEMKFKSASSAELQYFYRLICSGKKNMEASLNQLKQKDSNDFFRGVSTGYTTILEEFEMMFVKR